MFGGEIALVIPADHILGICFQYAGVGPGLGKDFANHIEVEPQGIGNAESFSQGGGIDVHHHID